MRRIQIIYMSPNKKHSFLYRFLISPKLRLWRHLFLIFAIGIIGFNQTVILDQRNGNILGNEIYLLGSVMVTAYLLVIYFNIYRLIPRYLFHKKYVQYLGGLCVGILLLLSVRILEENYVFRLLDHSGQSSYFNYLTVLDNLSYFMINTVCMVGGSMTLLLKEWLLENQRINKLENLRIQSEVEQLKDQVNPSLLFNILNKTGVISKSEPERASMMVMKLSQLLRYQLYESNRKKILANSEINFLNNYLILEKLYSDRFDYSVETEGDISMIFVPPLLFISFAQYAVEQVDNTVNCDEIRFCFRAVDNGLLYRCYCPVTKEPDFSRIIHRLDIEYDGRYSLSVRSRENECSGIIELQLNA